MADPFLKKQPSQLEKDTARKILENTLNKYYGGPKQGSRKRLYRFF
jgi:hypothetical protein